MRDNPNMSVKEACDMVSKSKGKSDATRERGRRRVHAHVRRG